MEIQSLVDSAPYDRGYMGEEKDDSIGLHGRSRIIGHTKRKKAPSDFATAKEYYSWYNKSVAGLLPEDNLYVADREVVKMFPHVSPLRHVGMS